MDQQAASKLDLRASFAIQRKKYLRKELLIGEGLLGQAFLEKETLLITVIPPDYIKITSGMGEADPKSILIVPMVSENTALGVLEVASLQELTPFEIEFCEKAVSSVASTLQTLHTNTHTKSLLDETKRQNDLVKAQEEILRQNIEELQTTQEEMQRLIMVSKQNQMELEARIAQVNLACIVSESDLYGTITFANEKFADVSQYSLEELIGKPHSIVRHPDTPKEVFKEMWTTLKRGELFRGVIKNRKKDGSPYWVDATIAPIKNHEGQIVKYLGIRYDITSQKLLEEELKQTINLLSQQSK